MVSAKKHAKEYKLLSIDIELIEKFGNTSYNYIINITQNFTRPLSKIEVTDSDYRYIKRSKFPEYKNLYIYPDIRNFENGDATLDYVDRIIEKHDLELEDFLTSSRIDVYHEYRNREDETFDEDSADFRMKIVDYEEEFEYRVNNLRDYYNDHLSDKYVMRKIKEISDEFDKMSEELKTQEEVQSKKSKKKAEREARKQKKAKKLQKEKEEQERRLQKQKEDEEERKKREEERLAQEKREHEAQMEK